MVEHIIKKKMKTPLIESPMTIFLLHVLVDGPALSDAILSLFALVYLD